MGLIKEPINIDFSFESNPWSKIELEDFRKLMLEMKSKNKNENLQPMVEEINKSQKTFKP